MFFDSWNEIGRVILMGALIYIALIASLRLSGKRTLSKMNAFDLIVTVSLGSIIGSTLLSQQVSLAEGVAALLTLILLQYLIAWLSVRSETFQSLIKSEPRLLMFEGRFLNEAMRAERVTREEVIAAVREQGFDDLSDVGAVVLETDGTFSALQRGDQPYTALQTLNHETLETSAQARRA